MNVFEAIGHGIKWVAVKVAHGFEALFGKPAAEAFAHASLELLKSATGKIVLSVVAGLMQVKDATGDQKREQAFTEIVTQLEQQGISLGKDILGSEINMLIELAVNALKGRFEPVTS